MLSSSLDTFLKVSRTTSPPKLLAYDCVTLYFQGAGDHRKDLRLPPCRLNGQGRPLRPLQQGTFILANLKPKIREISF